MANIVAVITAMNAGRDDLQKEEDYKEMVRQQRLKGMNNDDM